MAGPRGVQGTGKGAQWLVAALRGGGRTQRSGSLSASATGAQASQRFARTVFQALALFRFFTFAMGIGLTLNILSDEQPTITLGVAAGAVGLYNVVRIVWRTDPGKTGLLSAVALAVDVVLAVVLVLLTGGLDSPFLTYSLAPILSASLLMSVRSAITVAIPPALSVSGAHVVGGLGLGEFPWILSGNYLAFALLYAAGCLLVALLPFLSNLSWERHMRAQAEAAERTRLRREVHDNIAQALAFLSLKVKRAEERMSQPGTLVKAQDVQDIARVVERCYLAVRDYLDNAEVVGSEAALGTSLAMTIRQWSRDTGLPVQMEAQGEEGELPPAAKLHLVQIVREALANVSRHASPAHVWVKLECTPTQVTLRVQDDGRGFPPSQPRGHGLNIVHERAAMVGASLTVSSAPGEGTEVVVVYPRDSNGVAP